MYEDNDEEDIDLIVAVSHNEAVAVFSINTIIKHYGDHCSVDDIEKGVKIIDNGHTKVCIKARSCKILEKTMVKIHYLTHNCCMYIGCAIVDLFTTLLDL